MLLGACGISACVCVCAYASVCECASASVCVCACARSYLRVRCKFVWHVGACVRESVCLCERVLSVREPRVGEELGREVPVC